MVLVEEHLRVADQERAHVGAVECEHAPARPLLAGEVQAVAAVRGLGEVEVVDALRVESAAGVVVDHVDEHGDPVHVADVDERLQLVDLTLEVLERQRRASLLREQGVDALQIRRQVGRVDAVVHLRREDVGAVVAEAPLAGELDDGQRLEGVDAEVGEVLDPVERVQELRHAPGPAVAAGVVAREEPADVELVDDEVVERRRPEACVVPRVRARVAHDAVAVGVVVQLELARPRVALQSRATRSDDEEPVLAAVDHVFEEPGPVAGGRVLDELVLRPGLILVGAAESDVHVRRARCPDAERRAVADQVRTHRRRRGDVRLRCGQSDQAVRGLPPVVLGTVTCFTTWPWSASAAQAVAIRSSRTPGQQAIKPGLSGLLTNRACIARSSSASVSSLNS